MFLHKITIKMSGKTPLPPRPPPRQAIVAASRHRSKGDNRGPLPHASALCSSASEEGEGLMTTTIRPRCPPCHDHLRLQWRPKTIQRSGRGDDNDTIDGSKSNQQSTNDAKWRGGGATGRRHDEGRGHAHNNQIDHTEGGVVGDDDNDDNDNYGHNDDNNNKDEGGCGGRDGNHRMRTGRGQDDRTNTTMK